MKTSDISTEAVLLACKKFHDWKSELPPRKILMEELNAPEKVVYSAMNREINKWFLEYGTFMRCAWVDEKGEDFLKNLKNKTN
jgi:hypothetical protein